MHSPTFKKKHRTGVYLAALLAVFVLACAPAAVFAEEPVKPPIADCKTPDGKSGVQVAISAGGINCVPIGGSELQTNPIFIYLSAILKVVAGLAGVACVGGFVWGATMYATARANAGQTEKGRMIMLNSVIGLLLFIFMFAILQFLVPGGVFT